MKSYFTNKKTSRLLLFYVLSLFSCVLARAQVTIYGKVNDTEGKPILGVNLIFLNHEKKIKGFAISKTDGTYSVKLSPEEDSLWVTVSKLGCTSIEKTVVNKTQQLDIILVKGVIDLKEIEVKPPPIRKRGDTLSFKVEEFQSVSDRSIGDVIQKLPGIEVDPRGNILYQGKAINRYYVENMNLMGTQYSLLNENLPKGKVATIEILENHQPIRVLDSLKISENAAINLTLRNKYTTAAKIDYGIGGSPLLWDINVTPFVFIPKFQFLGSLQSNNVGKSTLNQQFNFLDTGTEINQNWLSVIPVNAPPFSAERWLKNTSHFGSVNGLKKTKKELELRLNTSLTLDKQKQSGSTNTQYLLGDNIIMYSETVENIFNQNQVRTSLNLEKNSTKNYFKNSFDFEKNWRADLGTALRINRDYHQDKSGDNLKLSNHLHKIFTHKKTKFNFYSVIAFSTNQQTLKVGLSGLDTLASPLQTLSAKNLYTHHYVEFSKRLIAPISLSLNLGAKTQNSAIDASLFRYQELNDTLNNFSFNTADFYASPSLSFTAKKLQAIVRIPVSYLNIYFKELKLSNNYNKWIANPDILISLKLNKNFTLTNSARLHNMFSSVGDMYLGYIMRNYLEVTKGNTNLNHLKNIHLSSGLRFSEAVTGTVFHTNYTLSKVNQTNTAETDIKEDGSLNTVYATRGNTSLSHMINAQLSKYLFSIKTGFTLGFTYRNMISERVFNQTFSSFNYVSYQPSVSINYSSSQWFNFNHKTSFNLNKNKTSSINTSQINHDMGLIFIPDKKILAILRVNYTNLKTVQTQNFIFGDITLRYTLNRGKQDIELKLTNIFNQSQFSSIHQTDYMLQISNLQLRPRQIIISSKLNI